MHLTLGYSPCPNDTFIFDALVNKKIDTGNLSFDVILEDVQTLNQWAIQGKLDVSKISYGSLPLVLPHYKMLLSGGALGKGVGPLLISAGQVDIHAPDFDINQYTVVIPGKHTTAHWLFSLAFPQAENKVFRVFNEIEDFLLQSGSHKTLGVIIHENRFTYAQRGLNKLMDLGSFWEQKTGFPIPLGGIAVRKTIGEHLQQNIQHLIAESIRYAFSRYPELPAYVRMHAQEMNESVMRQHIDLYVNDYSLNLGEDGKRAVGRFLDIFAAGKNIPFSKNDIFIK